jgi:D-glycero-D-manno-heptose 1,7-bisphosphate phosphatase
VFLDRDGVVLEDTGYLCRVEDMRFVARAQESIAALNRAGIPVVMVTNQAGVGRGYYNWSEFETVQDALETELRKVGARLDGVWACAYHGDAIGEFRVDNHSHRKPNPGMLLEAARGMGLNVAQSWMVGDKTCDIQAGINAGVLASVHVKTGYGGNVRKQLEELYHGSDQVRFCDDLSEAVSLILADSAGIARGLHD